MSFKPADVHWRRVRLPSPFSCCPGSSDSHSTKSFHPLTFPPPPLLASSPPCLAFPAALTEVETVLNLVLNEPLTSLLAPQTLWVDLPAVFEALGAAQPEEPGGLGGGGDRGASASVNLWVMEVRQKLSACQPSGCIPRGLPEAEPV